MFLTRPCLVSWNCFTKVYVCVYVCMHVNRGGLPDGSIRWAQQWERGGGPDGRHGAYEKCQRKVNKWNRPWYGPHRAHNQLKWWLRDSRGLYSALRSFTVTLNPLSSHQSYPDCLYGLPMAWEGAASRSRPPKTSSFWQWNLIAYWCPCVCDKKLNFLSWAIRPVFADPVTIIF